MTIEMLQLSASAPYCILFSVAVYAFGCIRSVRSGLFILAALTPTYLIRLSFGGLPSTVLELFIIVLTVTFFVKDGRWKRINWSLTKTQTYTLIPPSLRWPLALFMIAGFMSAVISPAQPEAFGIFRAYLLEPFFVFIVATYTLRDEHDIRRLLGALGFTVAVLGVIALVQYVTGIGIANPTWFDPLHRRVTTFYGYPNAASLFAGPVIGALLAYTFLRPTRGRWMAGVVVVFGLAILVTARTQGALVAVAAVLWLLAILSSKARKITAIGSIIMLVLIAIIGISQPRYHATWKSLTDSSLDLTSNSLDIRLHQWRETLTMLADRPLMGAGLAAYQQTVRPYHRFSFIEIYLYPHSLLLNFWSELGLAGVVAVVWLFIALARILIPFISGTASKVRTAAIALVCFWLIILIHGLVDVPFFKNDLAILWMLGVAMTATLGTTSNRRHPEYSPH